MFMCEEEKVEARLKVVGVWRSAERMDGVETCLKCELTEKQGEGRRWYGGGRKEKSISGTDVGKR